MRPSSGSLSTGAPATGSSIPEAASFEVCSAAPLWVGEGEGPRAVRAIAGCLQAIRMAGSKHTPRRDVDIAGAPPRQLGFTATGAAVATGTGAAAVPGVLLAHRDRSERAMTAPAGAARGKLMAFMIFHDLYRSVISADSSSPPVFVGDLKCDLIAEFHVNRDGNLRRQTDPDAPPVRPRKLDLHPSGVLTV